MVTRSMGKSVMLDRDKLRRMKVAATKREDVIVRRDYAVTYGVPYLKPFDAGQTRDALVDGIREKVHDNGFARVVVGISGGKDSTVTAALCVRALGRENVFGVMMPDGVQHDIADSEEVVKALGIPHFTVNIGQIHETLKTAVPMSEIPNVTDESLVASDINVAPRIRMTVLRYVCQATGALLAGTGNLSEIQVGYFTKDGDSSCDIAVLAGLTSVEVVEIGKTLDEVPRHLVDKPPADGLSGQTDEERLGVSYVDIHNWVRCRTSGRRDVDERIASLHRSSAHKRARPEPFWTAERLLIP